MASSFHKTRRPSYAMILPFFPIATSRTPLSKLFALEPISGARWKGRMPQAPPGYASASAECWERSRSSETQTGLEKELSFWNANQQEQNKVKCPSVKMVFPIVFKPLEISTHKCLVVQLVTQVIKSPIFSCMYLLKLTEHPVASQAKGQLLSPNGLWLFNSLQIYVTYIYKIKSLLCSVYGEQDMGLGPQKLAGYKVAKRLKFLWVCTTWVIFTIYIV